MVDRRTFYVRFPPIAELAAMSALGAKQTAGLESPNVRYGSKAEVQLRAVNVRFRPEADIQTILIERTGPRIAAWDATMV